MCVCIPADTKTRYRETECIQKEMEKDVCLSAQIVICVSLNADVLSVGIRSF